ncbi:MAG: hypothetical protein KGD64_13450, partial [Candidatus Heimdallarchaeota archaeon]|nr:hypothetical protein [Candidatus Heimdallarchaeota archaeon]
ITAYRELHKIETQGLKWGEHDIDSNTLYYRYGYLGGYSWLNFEREEELDVGAGVSKSVTKQSAKGIVNDFVNSNAIINNEKLREGGGGKIIIRRPITLVWYGFVTIGQAACQTIPTNGCGIGTAMMASKIAAEVIVNAIRRKEVSIDSLWEYQVRFTQERGRDLATIDILRLGLQKLNGEDISFLLSKGIISRMDLENLIHAKFRKRSFLKSLIVTLKGIKRLKLLLYLRKISAQANKVFAHYKKLPKDYDTRKYHQWLLRSMQLFREVEDLEPIL